MKDAKREETKLLQNLHYLQEKRLPALKQHLIELEKIDMRYIKNADTMSVNNMHYRRSTNNNAGRRIMKEWLALRDDPIPGISVTIAQEKDDNNEDESVPPHHFLATIQGPTHSPYETGIFVVDIHLPDDYPFQPPQIRFLTPVYHCNISSTSGIICLDGLFASLDNDHREVIAHCTGIVNFTKCE